MAKKKTAKRKVKNASARSQSKSSTGRKSGNGLAIVAIILNLIDPGVRSMVGGKIKVGLIQLIIFIAISFLLPWLFFIPVWIALIIWGIFTGVKLMH